MSCERVHGKGTIKIVIFVVDNSSRLHFNSFGRHRMFINILYNKRLNWKISIKKIQNKAMVHVLSKAI